MNRAGLNDSRQDERPKLLSLVMGARNDQYMGNFKYRITTALNYMARNLTEIGRLDDVELLITDWGSEIPLSKALSLSSAAAKICRFIYVPPEIALSVQPDGGYHSIVPINAGIRRGAGKFLGLFDSDSLYQTHSLKALLDLLDGRIHVPFDIHRALYVLGRFHIPWEMVLTEPSLEEWDRFLLLSAGSLRKESTAGGLGISTSFHIMSRSLWFEHRAYDERLGGWGWSDAELALRVTQRCPWVDLLCFGVLAYHMDHWIRDATPKHDSRNPSNVVGMEKFVNNEDWGLGDLELDIRLCENICEPVAGTRSDSTVGQTTVWNKTNREVRTELRNSRVIVHAEQTMTKLSFLKSDWEVLSIVSWYSLYHYPRVLLEFGAADVGAALAVYLGCPNVEIYSIDPLQHLENIPVFFIPLHDVRAMTRMGHAGYRRLVTGDPATAFRRLKESFVGPFATDLVIFRADLFRENAADRLCEVLAHLVPGGAACVTSGSPDRFTAVWTDIRRKFPHLTCFRCVSGKTGLLLAARLGRDLGSSVSADSDETVLDVGKPTPMILALARNVIRKLSRPARYPDYVRQLLRLIASPGHQV